MKTTLIALLAANVHGQPEWDPVSPPVDTTDVDCGSCENNQWWFYNWVQESFNSCSTTATCDEGMTCGILTINEVAQVPGLCIPPSMCEFIDEPVNYQDEVVIAAGTGALTGFCNPFDTSATGEDLDIADAIYWNKWTSDLTTCTTDADCTASGFVCGTNALDYISDSFCVEMEGQCATEGVDTAGAGTGVFTDGSSSNVNNSLSTFTTTCTSDAYTEWLWKTNNIVDQATAAGCATVDPECNTIAWNGSAGVAAFCGTAKLENDSGYAVLGCYPTADCELMGGLIPGSEAKYILACGATSLFTSAFAASVAIAALL